MANLAIAMPQNKKGLTAFSLKNIAIAAMFVDHLAFIVAQNYYSPLGTAMHFVGRITGPLMFYMLAQGYHHTKNKQKYALRLFIGAVVSYLPYIYYFYGGLPNAGNFFRLNVMYTLLLAFAALHIRNQVKNVFAKCAGIGLCFLLANIGDWGMHALVYVLLFDIFRGNFKKQALAYLAAVALLNVAPVLPQIFLQPGGVLHSGQLAYLLVQAGMLVPVFLLMFYNGLPGKNTKAAKWVFYAFYPAHLLVLIIVAALL